MIGLIGSTLNFISRIAPGLAGKLTFALFCYSRAVKVREADRKTHEEAVAETLMVNGNRIVTYRWGDGERPILLLHGWESRASRYAALVQALRARGLSPITFDAPGHGDSSGKATILEYHAIIQRLHRQYGRFVSIVAHSFGVPCAFYAVRKGIETSRLVAISGPCEFRYLTETFCAQLRLRPALHEDLCRRTETFFAPEAAIWDRFSVSHRPEQISVPILVIHDDGDDVVKVEQAHKIISAYGPQARLTITSGLGHRRIVSDPRVIESVVSFVGQAGESSDTARNELDTRAAAG